MSNGIKKMLIAFVTFCIQLFAVCCVYGLVGVLFMEDVSVTLKIYSAVLSILLLFGIVLVYQKVARRK